jgi:hypothetical protein
MVGEYDQMSSGIINAVCTTLLRIHHHGPSVFGR